MAGLCYIHRVFQKDRGVVVGESHRSTPGCQGGLGQRLGGRRVRQGVHLPGFGHVPILAKLAGQITSSRAKAEDRGAGQKMIQLFLFYGIDAKPR